MDEYKYSIEDCPEDRRIKLIKEVLNALDPDWHGFTGALYAPLGLHLKAAVASNVALVLGDHRKKPYFAYSRTTSLEEAIHYNDYTLQPLDRAPDIRAIVLEHKLPSSIHFDNAGNEKTFWGSHDPDIISLFGFYETKEFIFSFLDKGYGGYLASHISLPELKQCILSLWTHKGIKLNTDAKENGGGIFEILDRYQLQLVTPN